MKTLTQFISQVKTLHSLNEFIEEKLVINKDYNYTKKKQYFSKGDEWTNKCFDALKSHYSSSYNVELSSSGESICFYIKKKKSSMKNLVCAVYGNVLDLISFGPNENLKDSLGKQIIEIIDEV